MESMNKRRKKIYSPDEKQQHVKNWQESGLTMSEYSRQFGVSPASLSKWRLYWNDKSLLFQPIVPLLENPAPTDTLHKIEAINGIELVLQNGVLIRIPQMLEVSQAMVWIREIARCN